MERFLPFVDNWATCDQLSCRGLAVDPDAALAKVRSWLDFRRSGVRTPMIEPGSIFGMSFA